MGSDREILFKKLYYLLHRSLVDARNLSLAREWERLADLSDTFEIIPSLMARWDDQHLDLIRTILAAYQDRHPGVAPDYVAILEMDDADFAQVYGSW